MALPTARPGRRLHHRRQIDVQVYARGDGLWEVDARVSDVRADAVDLASGPRAAGQPIHDMLVRLVVDARFAIVEAGAETHAMPYEGVCDTHGDLYSGLVGMNLMKGFRHAVAERFGSVRGCTHINELAQVLPTAVVQALAGEVIDTRGDGPEAAEAVPDRPLPRPAHRRADGAGPLPALVPPCRTPHHDPGPGRRRSEQAMKIHEYQGKEILRQFGIPVPRGYPAFSVLEAGEAAQKLGGSVWVVKAQIHAGGRGKGGGVKLARSLDEVKKLAGQILGMQLKTHQTGPDGQKVRRLLIEEGADIKKEYYVAAVTDRATQKVAMMASSEGGMDIEQVAHDTPEKIVKVFIDPARRHDRRAGRRARARHRRPRGLPGAGDRRLQEALCLLHGHRRLAGRDQSADPRGRRRHPGPRREVQFRRQRACSGTPRSRPTATSTRRIPAEILASKFDLAYIQLDGNIGCLVNGAGLAMATMDTIKLFGGEPANFLDVGGGASAEKVTEAFKIMLGNPKVKAILVNIFGGIMRCDTIAEGVIAACKAVNLNVPLVVRMKGTNEEIGKKMLAESGLPIISADSMAEAAQKVMAALK